MHSVISITAQIDSALTGTHLNRPPATLPGRRDKRRQVPSRSPSGFP